jgi:group II intron reverse transcriptase/maturase
MGKGDSGYSEARAEVVRMNVNHPTVDLAHRLGTKGYVLEGVYRRMQDKSLFLLAYGNLASNEGITTTGVSSTDVVEGMSERRVDTLLSQLAGKQYRWKPARRVYIPKANGGTRPLGIPSFSDKLVQEVMRIILEAYYEPQFRDSSHGFRPNRSCHTALKYIQDEWMGTTWFIEGDIKGCFDNIDHGKLLGEMSQNVKDQQLLGFIGRMLEAGYMENWKYNATHSGTPQGGVISPLLANIMLHEFDKWVEDELIPKYTLGEKRGCNRDWNRHHRMYVYNKRQYRKTGNPEYEKRATERLKQMRAVPSTNQDDPDYRRLRYVRYADDFLLGFAGPKAEAEEIRAAIRDTLADLGLTLSMEKTHITHARTERAKFLGFELSVSDENHRQRWRKLNGRSFRYRTGQAKIRLHVPQAVVTKYVERYSKDGTPHPKMSLVSTSDFEIIRSYGEVYRGLANYYAPAYNVSDAIGKVQYVMLESCVRTLATKHKCKRAEIYQKYYCATSTGKKGLVAQFQNPKTGRTHTAEFGEVRFKVGTWPENVVDRNDRWVQVYRGTDLLKRLAANKCDLCGAETECVVHHIRGLRDLADKQNKGVRLNRAEQFAKSRWRKQVIVCHECHSKIHAGTYDGQTVQ